MLPFLRSKKKKMVLPGKLWDAVCENDPEELRMLLTRDKTKERIKKTGGKMLSSSLHSAILNRHYECTEELLKAGANPSAVGGHYPVMRAIGLGGDVRILKLLLDYGARCDPGRDLEWYRPLYLAALDANLECFRMMLLYGADPDYNCSDLDSLTSTPDDTSVLGMCLEKGYEAPFVKLLIQFGANLYLPDVQKILLHVDNDATKLLEAERAHPRPLVSQCRITIRRLLKQVGKLSLIHQLEIPNTLVQYLQFHNELDYPEKLPRYYYEIYKSSCTMP